MKRGGIVRISKGRDKKGNEGKGKRGRIGRMELAYQRMAKIQNSEKTDINGNSMAGKGQLQCQY